jgi:hypothetical protein
MRQISVILGNYSGLLAAAGGSLVWKEGFWRGPPAAAMRQISVILEIFERSFIALFSWERDTRRSRSA